MSWHVKGTYFENCSCDSVCPCTTSVLSRPADTERCSAFGIEFDQAGKNAHAAPFSWAA